MNFEVDLQLRINQFRQSNPSVKDLPDEQILSIMIKQGAIKLTDAQKLSIYAHNNDNQSENNTGLELERTTPVSDNYYGLIISDHSTQKKLPLTLCAAGKLANTSLFDCFPATNTSSNENNHVIFQSSDGQSFDLNNTIANRIKNTSTNLQKAEDDNGFIGSAWSWFKNTTGIGASSDKVRDLISAEEDLLKKFNENPQDRAQIFKQLTGEEYSDENLEKFIKGEIKLKSEIALGEYAEGQNMALDICADIVSGVAAVGIYTASVAAAPFTGGTSIAVGLASATASGAAIKTGLKYADAKSAGREYNSEDLQHDMITGGFSGALAPVTGGLGGAVGKTVATKLGVQAVKQVGKEVAEEAAKGGIKAGLKTALTNPTGYEYLGGNMLKRGTAMAAEFATDGALGGSIDGAFRTAYDGGDINDITSAAVGGFVGGAMFAPVIGGGMKAVGKGAQKAFGKSDVVIDANGNTTEQLSHLDFKNLKHSINERLQKSNIDPTKIEINQENIQLIDRIAHEDYISERMGLARLDPSPIKTKEQATVAGLFLDLVADKNTMDLNYLDRIAFNNIARNLEDPQFASTLYSFLSTIKNNDLLRNNESLRLNLGSILKDVNSPKDLANINKLLDTILSDERLYNNENIGYYLGEILNNIKTPNLAGVISKIIDKVLGEEHLSNNTEITHYLGEILRNIKTPQHAEAICKVFDNFLSGIYDSTLKIKNNIGTVLSKIKTPETVDLLDRFVIANIDGDVFYLDNIKTPEAAAGVIKVFDKIFNDDNFKNISWNYAFSYIKSEKHAEAVNRFLEKCIQNPESYLHEKIKSKLGLIVHSLENPEAEKFLNIFFDIYTKGDNIASSRYQDGFGLFLQKLPELCYNPKYGFIKEQLFSSDKTEQIEAINLLISTDYGYIDFLGKLSTNDKYSKEERMLIANYLPKDKNQHDTNIVDFIDEIFFDKNYDHIPLNIKVIITEHLKAKNIDDIKEFLTSPECRSLSKEYIANIAVNINSTNMKLAKELCNDPEFPKDFIADIIQRVNKENEKFTRELCINPDFPKKYISWIIVNSNKENEAFVRELCNNPLFPKEHIDKIVPIINKDNEKFVKELCKDRNFPKVYIPQIINYMHKDNEALVKELCRNKDFPKEYLCRIEGATNKDNIEYATQLCRNYKALGMGAHQIYALLKDPNPPSIRDIQKLKALMGDSLSKINGNELLIANRLAYFCNKTDINTLSMVEKKKLLRELSSYNSKLFNVSDDMKKHFPLLPTTQEEYCSLLSTLVRSIGIDVKQLNNWEIDSFNKNLTGLSAQLAKLDDINFEELTVYQTYSKDTFISDALQILEELSQSEKTKVFDYFGFEIKANPNAKTGYSIIGYPSNLNNGKKLASITNPKTKEVIERLRKNVIRFSENNPIISNNKDIEKLLNNIAEALPEIRTSIGKTQHSTHSFDIMKHSLKIMQKLAQDPKFKELSPSDQKIMLLASLLHDITKVEGLIDQTHALESSFDSSFIVKKFNLTYDEEYKLYTLIQKHEWLKTLNTANTEDELTKLAQSLAYDLRHDNILDLAIMFTHADLKAVKTDDSFHDIIKPGALGTTRSYGEATEILAKRLHKYVDKLKASQPLLPSTQIPGASRIKSAITHVNKDGSTNIKGVYLRDDGLVILKYNEVEDWESIGFPKGSVSRGYKSKAGNNSEINIDTGNIKFIVHSVHDDISLAKCETLSTLPSDAIFSASYAECVESNWGFIGDNGIIVDVDTKHIHGGTNVDTFSEFGKSSRSIKNEYIFGGPREWERTYISKLIKDVIGMSDDEYIAFVEKYANKPFTEIEPQEVKEKLIAAFADSRIKGNVKNQYSEIYISNIKKINAVFSRTRYEKNIGNPIIFLKNKDTGEGENTIFLQKYALERDIPFIIFGD